MFRRGGQGSSRSTLRFVFVRQKLRHAVEPSHVKSTCPVRHCSHVPAPHKDFSYLYEKMSGRGESAVLSPMARQADMFVKVSRAAVMISGEP